MSTIPRQSYGIKLAAPGFDVNTAPDYELLFNSSWPSLAVGFEVTVTTATLPTYNTTSLTGAGGLTYYVIPHNLGFYPLVIPYQSGSGISYGRIRGTGISLLFDKNNIYVDTGTTLFANETATIQCINVDISQDVDYPSPLPGVAQTAISSNFGIKVAKDGEDINSTDLRDFVIHSRAQSPAVLSVITSESTTNWTDANGFNYTASTSYFPWFALFSSLDYTNSDGDNVYVNASTINATITSNTLTSALVPPASLVLMRDPLFPPTNVDITY